MSLIFNPPAYKSSGRIAHWCPDESLRMYRETNNSYKYQPHPQLVPYNKIASQNEARGARQTPTYESHIFTRGEADKINTNRSQRHEPDVQSLADNASSQKTTSTIPRNVYRELPNAPKGAIAEADRKPPAPMCFKKRVDPNRHLSKNLLKCDIKSFREPVETKVKEPKGYYGPTPRHLPTDVPFEQPRNHVVTLELSNVNEKFNIKDYTRKMAGKGHVIMESAIKNNPITNERNGTGVMHVRCKTTQELDVIKGDLNKKGINVSCAKDYKPVWNNLAN